MLPLLISNHVLPLLVSNHVLPLLISNQVLLLLIGNHVLPLLINNYSQFPPRPISHARTATEGSACHDVPQ